MDNELIAALSSLRDELPESEEGRRGRETIDGWLASLPDAVTLARELAALAVEISRSGRDRQAGATDRLELLVTGLEDFSRHIAGIEQQASAAYQAQRKASVLLERQLQDADAWSRMITGNESPLGMLRQRLSILRAQLDDQRAKEATQFVATQTQLGQLSARVHRLLQSVGDIRELIGSRAPATGGERATPAEEASPAEVLVDAITQLPNQTALERRLREMLDSMREHRFRLTLVQVEIDGWQKILERVGEKEGERVLRLLAQGLTYDFRATDFIAFGGDARFTFLLPNTGTDKHLTVGERLRQLVTAIDTALPGGPPSLTASIGVTVAYENDNPHTAELRAHVLAELARTAGGNRCEVG